ncbi:protein MULTIPLE CHLOROPLAST DIVISION SITE 1 [Iris pallida]|uniref:Protein MULTIPLE CHLOROPLAST DIVISION SITE 1 n=1 Tax=Iris pallida TaxID=29817 RepID=A0AAX6E6R4_IRIPA|nr:protein MULTIPLE CHLOROPLAST DIVISION SITE 1 [Iris pallida]
MATIPKSLCLLRHHSLTPRPKLLSLGSPRDLRVVRLDPRRNWGRSSWEFSVRVSATGGCRRDEGSDEGVRALQGLIEAIPPVVAVVKRNISSNFAIGFYITFAFLAIVVRKIMLKKQNYDHQGSVADLVKRGHLRSDRRGISEPLMYEDPFNNPLVKVRKSDSTVEVCGKVYRLAPVTLTKEEQSIHQKRRSRAYQWTRPKVFLKEGDTVPPDVDPDSVRWIPSNHPFATTVADIDEDMAKNNVLQKHGVPSRIRAEHEALQKKLQDLDNEQFKGVTVNPFRSQDLETPPPKPHEQPEPIPFADRQRYGHKTSVPDPEAGSPEKTGIPGELKKNR